jgi:hypothetical protein
MMLRLSSDTSDFSTVVEHSTRQPKIKDLSPLAAASTGREEMAGKRFSKQISKHILTFYQHIAIPQHTNELK